MPTVKFHGLNEIDDSLLAYAVIVSQHQGKWVYCKHKQRATWEIPGGRRESGEQILETATRELYEETGASNFKLTPICAYSVLKDAVSYGLLCFAEIKELGKIPESEIECIQLFDDEPTSLTYPEIQPKLMQYIQHYKITP